MATLARSQYRPPDPGTTANHNNSSNTNTVPDEAEIQVLAYALWQERGCPEGSPEEDWLHAERMLTERNLVNTPALGADSSPKLSLLIPNK
jgi:hypothetical protein